MERYHPVSETFVSDVQNLESLHGQECERVDTHPIRRDVAGQYMKAKHNPEIYNFASENGDLKKKVQCVELNMASAVENSREGLTEEKKIMQTKLNPDAEAFVMKPIEWSKLPLGPVGPSRSVSPVSLSHDASILSMSEDVTSSVNDGLFYPRNGRISPMEKTFIQPEFQQGSS